MGKTKISFSSDFKLKICQEIDSGIKTRSEVMREHDLVESVVAKWLSKFRSHGTDAFNNFVKKNLLYRYQPQKSIKARACRTGLSPVYITL